MCVRHPAVRMYQILSILQAKMFFVSICFSEYPVNMNYFETYLILTIVIYNKGCCRRPRSRESRRALDDENENNENGRKPSISDYLRDPLGIEGPLNHSHILEEKDISSKNILSNHFYYELNQTKKRSTGEVLVYVTPWNRKGYKLASLIASKIHWLVPVWLQVK